MRHLFVLAALLFAVPAHAVTIEWVTVGDPGNACDPQDDGCFGAVDYVYRIGKYEVTNAQYAEFLNAVVATDSYGLYNVDMANSEREWGHGFGGITRSGTLDNYTYSAIAGRENMPVNHVSFYDALRFANWLHNGQPVGLQTPATTEDGAYTITAQRIADNSIMRNANATVFLTSEDEWYKAAYYDSVSTSYLDYPAGADAYPACVPPSGDTGNSANCQLTITELTDVGAYSLSGSPYGTFDQGGNVSEWNESIIIGVNDSFRGERGGGFGGWVSNLAAADRGLYGPSRDEVFLGFRVAMIPEPSTALLLAAGLAGLAAAGRRRS